MTVGEKVRIIRKAKGLTQAEFAEPLGIRKSQVSGVENGTKGISDSVLRLMRSHYKVNATWWNTREGSIFLEDEPKEAKLTREEVEILEGLRENPSLYLAARDILLLSDDQLSELTKTVRKMLRR